MTTRERKLKFIESFGQNAMIEAITQYFHLEGTNWLTDEQLEVMVRNRIEDWKRSQRMNRRNRKRAA